MSQQPRRYPRQLRRLQVRFWRPREERPRPGFTKNLSLTGAFVSTPDPVGRGERLRLELAEAGRSVQVYAVVVHAHRVAPELRRFADSGMGLRFLSLDEIVAPFLGEEAVTSRPGDETGKTSPVAAGVAGGKTASPDGGPVPASQRLRGAGGPPMARSPGATAPGRAGSSSTSTDGSLPKAVGGPLATYVLAFGSAAELLETYRRDIVNGGLFLTTDRPARVDERVSVDLRLPGAAATVVRVEARVVQVVEPRPVASGRRVGGMGLEIVDPEGLHRQLAPHLPRDR